MADTIEIDVVLNLHDNTSGGLDSARHDVDRFTDSVRRSQQMADRLRQPVHVSVVDRATQTLSRIVNTARSITGKTWRAGVRVVDYATAPLRKIKNLLFNIKTLALAIGAGFIGKQIISKPISLADQYSSAKIGFSTLLGDKKGQQMMDNLDKFAKETPFKTSNTIAQAQKLLAMGWEAKNIVRDMRTIGDAAAATGKGDEGLNRIALALAQIKSKGKLSTEELNQLAEAGISAKRYIAEGLGYGSGDAGLAKMSKDLEKGAIGSEKALGAILKGMKEYKGMMDKTANETVEGLKSQIEDTFEINVFRKWGQGLQDGAKKGFGSIVDFLNKNEYRLSKFGDKLKRIGKELSNWSAGKLEGLLDKAMKLTERADFKDASLFGKIKIAWDDLIAKPFGEWWDSTGYPWMVKKMGNFGEGLGKGLSDILKGFLGIFDSSATKDASSIGSSFAVGFAKGFDAKGIVKAFASAFKSGLTGLFKGNWISALFTGYMSLKIASGIVKGLNMGKAIWLGQAAVGGAGGAGGAAAAAGEAAGGVGYVGGLKGLLGSASTASGALEGSGIIGGLARIGYATTGHGGLLAIAPQTGGGLAISGLGAVGGGILGGAGLISGGKNVYQAVKSDNSHDKNHYGWRAGTKIGMVGAGAAIGTAIAPGIGSLIGAGIGGLGALLAGDKIADKISGISKSTKELRQEAEKLKDVNMAKHFGNVELSAIQIQKRVSNIIGKDTIARVNKFNTAMQNLAQAESDVSSNSDDIKYFHERIAAGEKLSKNDITEYSEAIKSYTGNLKEYLSLDKKSARSAFQLLYGDDTKGLQKMTQSMNKEYTKLEKELDKKTKKLNKVMAKAFKDGKLTKIEENEIAKILNQIDEIEGKIKGKVEEAEKNARYDLIKTKYKNTDLTAESYKAMVGELDAQNAVDLKAYDDAYVEAKAKIDIQLEDGTISKKQWENKLDEIEDKWLGGKTETLKKSYEVTFDVVKTNYSKEFGNIENALKEGVTTDGFWGKRKYTSRDGKLTNTRTDWTKKDTVKLNDMQDAFLKGAGIDEKMQVQMKDLYDAMKPQEKELKALKKQYEEAGKQIPQWINDGLSNIENIKLMSGNKSIYQEMVGKQIAKEDAAQAKLMLEQNGKDLPKAFKKGIEEGLAEQGQIDMTTNLKLTSDKQKIDTSKLDKVTADAVDKMQSKGILKITKDGKVSVKTKDGKIDTTGLDDDTRSAILRLERSGVIQVNKKGEVIIKPKGKPDPKKLDDATNKAVKSLEDKGLIKVDRKGKVSIKPKGGINTNDVDKKTKSQLEKLEKAGVVKINKKGEVTIKAKIAEPKRLENSVQKAALKLEGKGIVKINKDGKVHIKPNINYHDFDKKTKAQLKKLEKAGVIKIKKNGEVKVVANVKTKSAEQLASKRVKAALAKKEKVKKNTDVIVTSKTFTSGAVTSTENAIDSAYANPFSVSAILNAHIQPQTPFPTLASNSYVSLKDSVTSKFSNPFSATAILNAKVAPSTPFSTLASNSYSSFKTSFTNKFSTGFSITAPFSVTPSKSGGGSKKPVGPVRKDGGEGQQANGGFSHGPQRILWGEDGPEVIIPLGAKRRKRGLDLLKKASHIMGADTPAYADGGFIGAEESGGSAYGKYFNNSEGTETQQNPSRNHTGKIDVNVGGIKIEISSSGDGAAADIMNSRDDICDTIAEALKEAFQNIPLAM